MIFDFFHRYRMIEEPEPCSSSDEEILNILEKVDNYANSRVGIHQLMADGFFELAKARKLRGSTNSIDDIRFEIDSSVIIDGMDEGTAMLSSRKPGENDIENDGLTLFSALPGPALRRAQSLFTSALHNLVSMACMARDINQVLDEFGAK